MTRAVRSLGADVSGTRKWQWATVSVLPVGCVVGMWPQFPCSRLVESCTSFRRHRSNPIRILQLQATSRQKRASTRFAGRVARHRGAVRPNLTRRSAGGGRALQMSARYEEVAMV